MWNHEDIHIRIAPEAVGMIGEPSGTRTRDPLIKRQYRPPAQQYLAA